MSETLFSTAASGLIDILFEKDSLCLLLSSQHFTSFMQNFDFETHGSQELTLIAKSDRQIQKFQCFVFKRFAGLHIEEVRLTSGQLALAASEKLHALGIDVPTIGSQVNKAFEKQVSWRRNICAAPSPFEALITSSS